MALTEALEKVLRDAGAALVGFGDMQGVENCSYPVGVSVAIPIPIPIIEGITEGPTKEYSDTYYAMNAKLNEIITQGARTRLSGVCSNNRCCKRRFQLADKNPP